MSSRAAPKKPVSPKDDAGAQRPKKRPPKKGSADAAQVLDVLRRFATQLPGAQEYVMVHHPAFRVGKKPFLIVGMEEQAANMSINGGPDMQAELLNDPRFSRTPYIGQHGWVTVLYHDCEPAEWRGLIEKSYRRVAGKRNLAKLDT